MVNLCTKRLILKEVILMGNKTIQVQEVEIGRFFTIVSDKSNTIFKLDSIEGNFCLCHFYIDTKVILLKTIEVELLTCH